MSVKDFIEAYINECPPKDKAKLRALKKEAELKYGKLGGAKKRTGKRREHPAEKRHVGKPAETNVDITEEEFRRLRVTQGLTRREVAEMFGTTDNVVRNLDRKYKVKVREIEKISPKELLTVKRMFIEQNMTAKQVAEAMGVSKSRIEHMLSNYGIRKRG